jgi:hypothetical protein
VIPYADPTDLNIPNEGDPNARPETVEASATIGEIQQRLKEDGEFFIEFFLADELTSPVPFFHHGEIWPLLTNTAMQRVLLAIPRDHAKTTLSKLAVVWYFLFTNSRFCVYLSNTNTIAKNACKDIIGYLNSPNFISVFGRIKVIKESETDSLWIFEIRDPFSDGRVKRCILRAVGAGQQMRGINIDNQRPDIAVVDDVEDNENTESPTLQAKLDKWIFGPFIKALARRKKIIWLGNMLQKTSLLARLSTRPNWNPVVFGCLVKDAVTGFLRPLWPERWPMDELIEDFQEYQEMGLLETWMCEMMNMPGHGVDGFTQDQINYLQIPNADEIAAAWLVLDPAFGEKAANDDSSITVHVLPKDGVPMMVAHSTSKMKENEIFDEMFRLALEWNAWVWGIEAVAAQRVLIPFFQLLLASKLMNHTVELVPLMAGSGDPKISRIKAFVALMAKGEYGVYEGAVEFTTQLVGYNMKKRSNRDDLIDSAAYGPQMLLQYEGLLTTQYQGMGDDIPRATYGTEVSGV